MADLRSQNPGKDVELWCEDEARLGLKPVTRRVWPRVYHRDVPVHQGGAAYGDVKFVWELNRHQFLIDLGKAFFFTRDVKYRDKATALQRSWP